MALELSAEQSDLLALIAGRGEYSRLGRGLYTYPKRDQENEQLLNEIVKLENAGLIHRAKSGPDWILWMPVAETLEEIKE